MKVYLVYQADNWNDTVELDSVYISKEKAVKRTAEIILDKWDECMDDVQKNYNKIYHTNYGREEFAYKNAENGGFYENGYWVESEAQ